MTRTTWGVALVLLALAVGLSGVSPAGQGKGKPPTVAEIMRKLNGGTTGLTPTLGKDLKDDEPDWEGIQESTKEYVELTAGLPGGTPPRGDKASWQRLARAYAAEAKALDAAARRKDKKGAAAVLARINNACKVCHAAHRKMD